MRGKIVMDVEPNLCSIPEDNVIISLIVRHDGKDKIFKLKSYANNFNFKETKHYIPDSNFYSTEW